MHARLAIWSQRESRDDLLFLSGRRSSRAEGERGVRESPGDGERAAKAYGGEGDGIYGGRVVAFSRDLFAFWFIFACCVLQLSTRQKFLFFSINSFGYIRNFLLLWIITGIKFKLLILSVLRGMFV